MSVSLVVALLVIGLFVGLLIGAVGIGGVLLAPVLVHAIGMDIHVAIASAMVAFFFAGGVGAIEFSRQGSIRWNDAAWLAAGGMPGAFIGAVAASAAPGVVLELLIVALIIATSLHSLCRAAQVGDDEPRRLTKITLIVIGVVTGIGSSMSGTGGPLVLIPILLWLRVPVLAAVGLSQAIQLPIAVFATVGNIAYGVIDFAVAAAVSAPLMIGVWFGARIAHRVSSVAMKRFVSGALLAVGVMMLARLALGAVGGPGA